MEDWEWTIDAQYQRVRAKLEGGMLYGQPIDADNMKQMVVAAYHAAHYRDTLPAIPAEAVQKRIDELVERMSFVVQPADSADDEAAKQFKDWIEEARDG